MSKVLEFFDEQMLTFLCVCCLFFVFLEVLFLKDPIVSCLLKHLTIKIKLKSLLHYGYDTVYSNPPLLVFYCFTFKGVPQVC